MISFIDLKLWLVKIGRAFAEPVTYNYIHKQAMHIYISTDQTHTHKFWVNSHAGSLTELGNITILLLVMI